MGLYMLFFCLIKVLTEQEKNSTQCDVVKKATAIDKTSMMAPVDDTRTCGWRWQQGTHTCGWGWQQGSFGWCWDYTPQHEWGINCIILIVRLSWAIQVVDDFTADGSRMDESFKETDNSSTDVQFDGFDYYNPWVSICQEGTDHFFVCANFGVGRITFSLSVALFCYIILC